VQLGIAAQQCHAAALAVLAYLRLGLLPLSGSLLVGGVGLQVFQLDEENTGDGFSL